MTQEQLRSALDPHYKPTIIKLQNGNQWMEEAKKHAVPKRLFGDLWFEGEVCILFADTNVGKSILAVQIADSISRAQAINGFTYQGYKQTVLYFDFELSVKQFENRYSVNFQKHYTWHPNFMRGEINPDIIVGEEYGSFEEYLNHAIETHIIETGSRVLIIDNLTYLRNDTERAKDALPLMKHLKALKTKYNLSILALAHTPKRDMTRPINVNDLQGSKMLINFCDSAFALGHSSTHKNMRYLKQIKSRNTEIVYDGNNVCMFEINKPHNFLQFSFLGYDNEAAHLKKATETNRDETIAKVKALAAEGKTQREIAKELNVSVGTVNRYLAM